MTVPRPLGSPVALRGRVFECASLLRDGWRPDPAREGERQGRLLDIGCSAGWLSEIALETGFREYVGLDRVTHGTPIKKEGVRFVEGCALALPFDDGSFDAVALFDVIQELPRGAQRGALREAARVLRPGGTLYLSAPHASVIHAPLDPIWLFGRRHYRRGTLRGLVESAGLTLESMFVAGGTVECLGYLRVWLHWHLLHRTPPERAWINRWVERQHGRQRRLGQTVFLMAGRPPMVSP